MRKTEILIKLSIFNKSKEYFENVESFTEQSSSQVVQSFRNDIQYPSHKIIDYNYWAVKNKVIVTDYVEIFMKLLLS